VDQWVKKVFEETLGQLDLKDLLAPEVLLVEEG
jgi:hypothetical protein